MDTDSIGPVLEEMVPNSLAESWDNVGWQVKLPGKPITGILLTLDVTEGVVDEAARSGCNLVFAHHPLLFRPLKSLDLGSPLGTVISRLLHHEISVWVAHTNLDLLPAWGTSFALAEALGLSDVRLLARVERPDYKIVVYVPPSHVEAVKNAMAEAGAGHIGNYSHCFWQVLGTGQFRPEEGSTPYLGAVGQEERVEEHRVEGVVPQSRLRAVLDAMRSAHPYEEIAYDLLPLSNSVTPYGFGAVGSLPYPRPTAEIARDAAAKLSSAVCQVGGDPNRLHQRVAVMGGSGSSFLGEAARSGATLFITADVRYHDCQDAVARGLDLVILDHYATERPVLDSVRERLERRLAGVPVAMSTTQSTPYVRVWP
ncbi:MAG: Nif3-like dinuclear metal center hexameric protein [Sphingomonadaceae bacterium]